MFVCLRTFCNRSASASVVTDQLFVVGPGVSPFPVKLVSQIVASKYVDLCNLLPTNLQVKEPEPQLLFNSCLVLTSLSTKSCQGIEDIATWTEALMIFSFILVSHFPHHWRDLLQYQLILRMHRHFNGCHWLVYDPAFREHVVATQLTDWSCMNAQLFSFHAVGASYRSPSSNDSSDWETTGSSGSIVVCKSWNRGCCTSPLSICHYTHRCSSWSGLHCAAACPTSWPRHHLEDQKRRA